MLRVTKFYKTPIFLVFSSIIFTLILCEMALRFNNVVVFKHNAINDVLSFIYHHEDMGWYSKDPDLYWRLNKGSFKMGHLIGCPTFLNINSHGVRGPEISNKKDENMFRIVCLGDSTTLGWEVKYNLTYEQQLQSLLNTEDNSLKFEVINAGVPGYTAYQGYMLLKRYISLWDPDIVTVYFGSNDSYDAKRFYADMQNSLLRRIDEKMRSRLRLYSLLKKIYLNIISSRYANATHKKRLNLRSEYENNLGLIVDLARENGAEVIFLTYPTYDEIYNNKEFHFNQATIKTANRKNCYIVNIVDAFKMKKPKDLFYDGVHPQPIGYKIIAQELAKAIRLNIEEVLN